MSLSEIRRLSLYKHWREILKVESAEPEQNFFELGGDSLAAMDLVARVQTDTGWELPLDTLFTVGTLGEIVAAST